jgi:succinoglycan biosynthesis protein ExoL
MHLLKILYLVPNLSDPAVARRVEMFRLGGAEVEIAGFRRADAPPPDLPLDRIVELDITHDARMLQRLLATLKARYRAAGWARDFSRPDVIVARNLEMLAIGNRLMRLWPKAPAIVYECLDIHRLMLRQDGIGRAMRAVEQRLMEATSLLLVSSPAFLTHYFDDQGAPPAKAIGHNPILNDADETIRIGWFGALRCHKSLAALDALSRAMEGRVEVTLRGRPALTEFGDFHGTTSVSPHLAYEGTYAYPGDLPAIYSAVNFVWAIDFFEEGQNSTWLLPNRIYEGCLNGAIPIALAGTETAAFIQRLGIGITIPDIAPETLRTLFAGMTPDTIRSLAAAVAALPPSTFRCEPSECRTLVDRLIRVAGPTPLELAA